MMVSNRNLLFQGAPIFRFQPFVLGGVFAVGDGILPCYMDSMECNKGFEYCSNENRFKDSSYKWSYISCKWHEINKCFFLWGEHFTPK